MLVHSVYFWLKDGLSDADRAAVRKGLESLATIKSAQKVYIGAPAATPKRPIVDSSYDFALTVILKDIAAHDAYQSDPIHTAFVANCSKLWKKLTIFDAM
jgi:hypothetical protein